MMRTLTDVLISELLKSRRTLGIWLALLAPAVVTGLELLVMWAQGEQMVSFAEENVWLWHTRFVLTLWGLFMLPLFVTLETALQAGLEHSSQSWKQLLAQPVPRWLIFGTKQLAGLFLIGASHLTLWLLCIVNGLLLSWVRPDLGFGGPLPWLAMLRYVMMVFLMAWLLIAVHSWVALRWSSFVVAMGFGVVATLSGVFFISSDLARYYPWAMPGLAANSLMSSGVPAGQLILGVVGGVILFLLGIADLGRREVF